MSPPSTLATTPLAPIKRVRPRMEFALPTINVIFLLMLYFLVAGTLAQREELGVSPPLTQETPADRLPRPLLLLNLDGQLVLDGVPLPTEALEAAVQDAIADAATGAINLLAPASLSAKPFLALLARLDAADVPVRLITIGEDVPQ